MIDPDEFFEPMWNIISAEMETVLTLGWDGERPGMSGGHWLHQWRSASGKTLYFFSSSDVDEEGPFGSLEDALSMEEFSMETPNPELSSDVLPLERLMEIGLRLVADGGTIVIDGQLYRRQGKRLEEVDEGF